MSNPFASTDDFEALRAAALGGDDGFERYRRREAAAARRHISRLVELQLSKRVERMVEVAIASSRAVLLVGPPGTGKTEILEQVVDRMDRNPARYGFTGDGIDSSWVTPEEEWTFDKLVLGETVENGEIQTVEGDLLQAIGRNQWLVLDETNRADMDRVLGGVLTWLSGKKVRVGTQRKVNEPALPVYLEWIEEASCQVRKVTTPPSVEYAAGAEWRMLGTYNAVDAQRVFRMGQALSRRFKHVPVPPASPEDFERIIAGHVSREDLLAWFVDRVTRLYRGHLAVDAAQIGPGLLIDVPAYVEKGLQMAAYDQAARADGGTEALSDLPDATVAGDGTGEDLRVAQGGVTQSLEERLIELGGDDVGAGAVGRVEFTQGSADSSADLAHGEIAAVRDGSDLGAEDGPEVSAMMEDLLAEAYLVAVGNLVAKYEPDLLDDLGVSFAASAALTPSNWAWVRENLHAMRA